MINIRKITSAIAAGTLIFSSLSSSAFAVSTLEISGNGSSSDNQISANKQVNTTVVQTNDAYVKNDVNSTASTGGNDANDNTGGDVTIATGNATSKTNLSTQVNLNRADIDNCNCNQDTDALISGNGSESDNKIGLNSNNNTSVFQDNSAKIKNYVDANASTGKNDANDNTDGNVVIDTGNATTKVGVRNLANFNAVSVDCGCLNNLLVKELGNGSYSTNKIYVDSSEDLTNFQDNRAGLKNYIDAFAKTGKNDANRNTGAVSGSLSDPAIITGHALSEQGVDNRANVNLAGNGAALESMEFHFDFDLSDVLGSLHLM